MHCTFPLILIILLLLGGCRAEGTDPPKTAAAPQSTRVEPVKIGCAGCHDHVQLDPAHQLACTACHGGADHEGQLEKAHAGLIARPGNPQHMAATCGKCHQKQSTDAAHALHFTMENKINAIRSHFGASNHLSNPAEIPKNTAIADPLALADDMLRRSCLRCHVFAKGDDYPAVTHGTGCSACHLAFKNGKMQSHAFVAPTDAQCLSCHYGNHVGNDYHGRYEHDYNWEYRTPYTSQTVGKTPPRPYGLESHDLAPDIHQQRGLLCIDCHRDSGHVKAGAINCRSCHEWKPGQPVPALANLRAQGESLTLVGRADGKDRTVPRLLHPAHRQYGKQVACQVCHGQWSFNDAPTHLLRSAFADYEPWERLIVQGSSEVEALLEHNVYRSDELPPTMRDGITGESLPGVWLQGYGQRRWEQMLIGKDSDGVIKVYRPILDLRLSMVEADGKAPFDNVSGRGSGLLPYTPHTTGHAGMFYRNRFQHLLPAGAE